MLGIHAQPYPMERWTDAEFRQFDQICSGLEKHGYCVTSTPIEGQFEKWCDGLKKSLRAIELRAELIRNAYGYRGLSRNLLNALHSDFPEPSWSVEVQL